MKYVVVLAALLLCAQVIAEEKQKRNLDTSDFSQAYIDQIKSERAAEETEEKVSPEESARLRREHDKFVRSLRR